MGVVRIIFSQPAGKKCVNTHKKSLYLALHVCVYNMCVRLRAGGEPTHAFIPRKVFFCFFLVVQNCFLMLNRGR